MHASSHRHCAHVLPFSARHGMASMRSRGREFQQYSSHRFAEMVRAFDEQEKAAARAQQVAPAEPPPRVVSVLF
jgi:hypothetical protein